MYSVSETRNCCIHRETVLCALQGFQIKQMIFFHSKRVSAMRNIIQNGLFVIQKNVYTFLFPFLRPKLIHAGCFIILIFFLKICWQRGRLSKFVHNNCFPLLYRSLSPGGCNKKSLWTFFVSRRGRKMKSWSGHNNSRGIRALKFSYDRFVTHSKRRQKSCSDSSQERPFEILSQVFKNSRLDAIKGRGEREKCEEEKEVFFLVPFKLFSIAAN